MSLSVFLFEFSVSLSSECLVRVHSDTEKCRQNNLVILNWKWTSQLVVDETGRQGDRERERGAEEGRGVAGGKRPEGRKEKVKKKRKGCRLSADEKTG